MHKATKTFLWILFGSIIHACAPVLNESNILPLANPASEYCQKQGGTLKIATNNSGQTGYCHLGNGIIVEEWDFYRSQSG